MSIERGLDQRFDPEGGKKLRNRKVFSFLKIFSLYSFWSVVIKFVSN
jgi:hypothetical protein